MKPYLEKDGNLVIPFGSDPKYHWWVDIRRHLHDPLHKTKL
jgi:hypothetical protein